MIFQGTLFPEWEIDIATTKTPERMDLVTRKRKKNIHNLNLLSGLPTEGSEDMPLVSAYNGPLPEDLIPFSEKKREQYYNGVHFFIYDYMIEPVWRSPSRYVSCLSNFFCAVAPDFSVFVDQPRSINVWNIYRNRWLSTFWQQQGIRVIPSASWGNIDSFEYCFDGLPENSIIAIGHQAIGKDIYYKQLYRAGVETLIEKKRPTKLLVYGETLDFTPEIEVAYYENRIQKLRRLCK